MATHPQPREAGLSSEVSQLTGREARRIVRPCPSRKSGWRRDTTEQIDGHAGQPVAADVGHHDGPGGEPAPAGQEPGGLAQPEVVQEHRGHHVVEAALGERQRRGIGMDETDLGPPPARRHGPSDDDGIPIDRGDCRRTDGAGPSPPGPARRRRRHTPRRARAPRPDRSTAAARRADAGRCGRRRSTDWRFGGCPGSGRSRRRGPRTSVVAQPVRDVAATLVVACAVLQRLAPPAARAAHRQSAFRQRGRRQPGPAARLSFAHRSV